MTMNFHEFLWHKKKTTTTNKKTKMYQQGPITPDNLLYTLLLFPKNALKRHGSCRELRKYFLYPDLNIAI